MKSVRLLLLIVLGLFVLYVKLTAPGSGSTGMSGAPAPASLLDADSQIPDKALHVLQIVRQTGQPPDGYVGGRVFENREGRLAPGGDYREFDVDPHNGQRNAERIIVEWNTKKAWYTGDHYQDLHPDAVILFDSQHRPSHRPGEHEIIVPPRLESKTALLTFLKEALLSGLLRRQLGRTEGLPRGRG
jgi:guanyl-specific ribonuclease Sa